MSTNHHYKCPKAQAWDIENVLCECPSGWPKRQRLDTLSIRQHAYRGESGFLLVGHPENRPHWRLRVFCTDRSILEKVRQAYRDEDPNPTRFLLGAL